jgi:trigger factor
MTNEPTIERLAQGRVVCTLAFSAEQAAESQEKAVRKLGATVTIEGFRPGTAPLEVLKEKIDEGALFEETVRGLLPETFEQLVTENDIKPVIAPKVEIESNNPITVKVTFVERPPVKLKGADKIKVKIKEVELEEGAVDQMITYVLKQHQQSTVVERPAKAEDRVTMDFWGEDENKVEVEGVRSQGHQAVIGSKVLLPGFEDELIGMKKGDSKDFTLIFPEKHQAEELRGKPVTFHVTVQQIEEVSLPELTDAFVKEHLQAESVDAFRKEVEGSMKGQEGEMERKKAEEEAMDKIREATQVDLAEELLEDEQRMMFEDIQSQLSRQGMSMEDWLKHTGKTAEQAAEEIKGQSEKRLTLRLGLAALVEERNLEITDEEMEANIAALISPLSDEEKKNVSETYAKGQNAYEQMKWQKKVEKLLESIITT